MKKTTRILLTALMLSATSCQETVVYHFYRPIPATGWQKEDTLVYALPQAIPNKTYQYEIGIRHKDAYPYRDIWLKAGNDTLHLYLADSTGNWIGNGIGETRQSIFPVRLSQPSQDSILEFRINHIMQDQPLDGILDIGLKIEELH